MPPEPLWVGVVWFGEEALGVVVVVGAGLPGVGFWGGIHSAMPLRMTTVQPCSARRLSGPQASTSSSMLVWPLFLAQ
jgi:hypothetical protein